MLSRGFAIADKGHLQRNTSHSSQNNFGQNGISVFRACGSKPFLLRIFSYHPKKIIVVVVVLRVEVLQLVCNTLCLTLILLWC